MDIVLVDGAKNAMKYFLYCAIFSDLPDSSSCYFPSASKMPSNKESGSENLPCIEDQAKSA